MKLVETIWPCAVLHNGRGITEVKFVTRVFLIRLGQPTSQSASQPVNQSATPTCPSSPLSIVNVVIAIWLCEHRVVFLFLPLFTKFLIEKILQFCHLSNWVDPTLQLKSDSRRNVISHVQRLHFFQFFCFLLVSTQLNVMSTFQFYSHKNAICQPILQLILSVA